MPRAAMMDRYRHPQGYVYLRVRPGVKRREHVWIAEQALGKPLPRGVQVHHFNGEKGDNGRGNLVVCQDASYHRLLEVRQRAFAATGDPNKRRCVHCKEWDDPQNLVILSKSPRNRRAHHRACHTAAERARREARKSA